VDRSFRTKRSAPGRLRAGPKRLHLFDRKTVFRARLPHFPIHTRRTPSKHSTPRRGGRRFNQAHCLWHPCPGCWHRGARLSGGVASLDHRLFLRCLRHQSAPGKTRDGQENPCILDDSSVDARKERQPRPGGWNHSVTPMIGPRSMRKSLRRSALEWRLLTVPSRKRASVQCNVSRKKVANS
jgi:hypothetical protein